MRLGGPSGRRIVRVPLPTRLAKILGVAHALFFRAGDPRCNSKLQPPEYCWPGLPGIVQTTANQANAGSRDCGPLPQAATSAFTRGFPARAARYPFAGRSPFSA